MYLLTNYPPLKEHIDVKSILILMGLNLLIVHVVYVQANDIKHESAEQDLRETFFNGIKKDRTDAAFYIQKHSKMLLNLDLFGCNTVVCNNVHYISAACQILNIENCMICVH